MIFPFTPHYLTGLNEGVCLERTFAVLGGGIKSLDLFEKLRIVMG